MEWILKPNPDLDYTFLTAVYGIGFLIGIVILVLEKGEYQDVQFPEGSYIIFMPFAPCLLWGIIVRSRWLLDLPARSIEKEN